MPNYRIQLKILNIYTNTVESRPKNVLKTRAKHLTTIMDFSLCLCICWKSCVQASINLNLRFGFYPVNVDNLMKNLEDLIKTMAKLCVGRVFLNPSELACHGYYK